MILLRQRGGGLDIPLLTASSRLDVSTLNLEEPIFSEYLDE